MSSQRKRKLRKTASWNPGKVSPEIPFDGFLRQNGIEPADRLLAHGLMTTLSRGYKSKIRWKSPP